MFTLSLEGFRSRHSSLGLVLLAESPRPSSSFWNLQTFQLSNLPTFLRAIPCIIRTYKKHAPNPFGIRTYKTQDLKSFRIRTYKKRGVGVPGGFVEQPTEVRDLLGRLADNCRQPVRPLTMGLSDHSKVSPQPRSLLRRKRLSRNHGCASLCGAEISLATRHASPSDANVLSLPSLSRAFPMRKTLPRRNQTAWAIR